MTIPVFESPLTPMPRLGFGTLYAISNAIKRARRVAEPAAERAEHIAEARLKQPQDSHR